MTWTDDLSHAGVIHLRDWRVWSWDFAGSLVLIPPMAKGHWLAPKNCLLCWKPQLQEGWIHSFQCNFSLLMFVTVGLKIRELFMKDALWSLFALWLALRHQMLAGGTWPVIQSLISTTGFKGWCWSDGLNSGKNAEKPNCWIKYLIYLILTNACNQKQCYLVVRDLPIT